MTPLAFIVGIAYVLASTLFVLGLHQMRAPSTARRGNLTSALGMAIAIVATVIVALLGSGGTAWGWIALVLGLAGAPPLPWHSRTLCFIRGLRRSG
jgi:NAD(P) transhydrogenase subunit beta